MAGGTCEARAKGTYWSVLLALLAMGVVSMLIGQTFPGIAILVFTVPGVLGQLRLASQTMRTWHLGGCVCWLAFSTYRVVLLTHPSNREKVGEWILYTASLGLTAAALLLHLVLHLARHPDHLQRMKARSASLIGRGADGALAPAADPEVGTRPLVWPPPGSGMAGATSSSAWPPLEGFHVHVGEAPEGPAAEVQPAQAAWPPPGYTAN